MAQDVSQCGGDRKAVRVEDGFTTTLNSSRSALRAWSFALGILGVKVPPWESPATPPPLSATMAAFAGYLNDVRGNPPQTVHKKLTHMAMFVEHCRKRRRAVHRARLKDIDDFIVTCRQRYARTTVADICSTVRGISAIPMHDRPLPP